MPSVDSQRQRMVDSQHQSRVESQRPRPVDSRRPRSGNFPRNERAVSQLTVRVPGSHQRIHLFLATREQVEDENNWLEPVASRIPVGSRIRQFEPEFRRTTEHIRVAPFDNIGLVCSAVGNGTQAFATQPQPGPAPGGSPTSR